MKLILKRILIPPLIPPLVPTFLVIAVCAWAVWDETTNGVQVIDGVSDNAPRRAAMFMILLSPIFYGLFLGVNAIDGLFDRFGYSVSWFCSLGFGTVATFCLFFMMYIPDVDGSLGKVFGWCLLGVFVVLGAMGLLRRLFFMPKIEEVVEFGVPPRWSGVVEGNPIRVKRGD